VLSERVVERFGTLPEILSGSAAELESVEGIGAATARHIRDGLARLVEASIFERFE
jgi:diadenylate cyclase